MVGIISRILAPNYWMMYIILYILILIQYIGIQESVIKIYTWVFFYLVCPSRHFCVFKCSVWLSCHIVIPASRDHMDPQNLEQTLFSGLSSTTNTMKTGSVWMLGTLFSWSSPLSQSSILIYNANPQDIRFDVIVSILILQKIAPSASKQMLICHWVCCFCDTCSVLTEHDSFQSDIFQ